MDHTTPPRGPIRGHIRAADYRRVAHGLFLPIVDGLDEELEFRRDLHAWLLVLPAGAVFTHVTAARLRGWQLPHLPEQVPVFAAVELEENRPRRPGLICSRLVREVKPELFEDLPVEPPHEILLRAARDLGLLDLVIMVDSARRLRHVDDEAMRALLASGRPGVRLLRRAWELSDARAESAGETVLRLFDVQMDVEVRPQATVYDEAGNAAGRVDLLVVGTNIVHEYDGAHHRRGMQHRTDLRRDRGLAGASYERRGFTLDDLVNHAAVVMHEVDRDLKRDHRAQRLLRWRRLVANSLYGAAGRRRVMNRWQRAMGTMYWSRPA